MLIVNKIKMAIQNFAEKCPHKPAIMFLTTKAIKNLSKEELKEIWLFAKARFITIHIVGKNDVYELNKEGKLELI